MKKSFDEQLISDWKHGYVGHNSRIDLWNTQSSAFALHSHPLLSRAMQPCDHLPVILTDVRPIHRKLSGAASPCSFSVIPGPKTFVSNLPGD